VDDAEGRDAEAGAFPRAKQILQRIGDPS